MSVNSVEYNPLVSVIVPTYNCGEFINETLASILSQSYKNTEIIVVDDGSTDNTSEVVGAIINRDSRISYIYKANGGQPTARNEGLRAVRGELVAFCDSDDIWMPDKLKLQTPYFRDPKIGACYTGMQRFDSLTGETIPYCGKFDKMWRGAVTHHLLLDNFVGHSSVVARKTCLDEVGGFDEAIKMGDDWDMILRLSTCTEFACVEKKMVRYRMRRAGQITSNPFARKEWSIKIINNFVARYPHKVSQFLVVTAKQNILIEEAWALRDVSLSDSTARYWEAICLSPCRVQLFSSLFKNILLLVRGKIKSIHR